MSFSLSTIFSVFNLLLLIAGIIYYGGRHFYTSLQTALSQEDAQRQAWANSISGLRVQKNNLLLAQQQEQQLAQQLLVKTQKWATYSQEKKQEEERAQAERLKKQEERLHKQREALMAHYLLQQSMPHALEATKQNLHTLFHESAPQEEYINNIVTFLKQS